MVPVCLHVCLSICLSVCMSVFLPVCLYLIDFILWWKSSNLCWNRPWTLSLTVQRGYDLRVRRFLDFAKFDVFLPCWSSPSQQQLLLPEPGSETSRSRTTRSTPRLPPDQTGRVSRPSNQFKGEAGSRIDIKFNFRITIASHIEEKISE